MPFAEVCPKLELGGIPIFQYYRDIHLLDNRIEQKTVRSV